MKTNIKNKNALISFLNGKCTMLVRDYMEEFFDILTYLGYKIPKSIKETNVTPIRIMVNKKTKKIMLVPDTNKKPSETDHAIFSKKKDSISFLEIFKHPNKNFVAVDCDGNTKTFKVIKNSLFVDTSDGFSAVTLFYNMKQISELEFRENEQLEIFSIEDIKEMILNGNNVRVKCHHYDFVSDDYKFLSNICSDIIKSISIPHKTISQSLVEIIDESFYTIEKRGVKCNE